LRKLHRMTETTEALRAAYAKVGSHKASLLLARTRISGASCEGTASKAEETLSQLEDLLLSLKLRRQASMTQEISDLSQTPPVSQPDGDDHDGDETRCSPQQASLLVSLPA